MMIRNLLEGFKTSSTTAKLAVIAAPLIVVVILIIGVTGMVSSYKDRKYEKQSTTLKEENQRLTDSYNQKIGEAHAKELAAREDKQKSDAMLAEYQQRMGNVKALDKKLDAAEAKYEQAKQDLGDCPDQAECLKRLCLELKAAGFKVKCD